MVFLLCNAMLMRDGRRYHFSSCKKVSHFEHRTAVCILPFKMQSSSVLWGTEAQHRQSAPAAGRIFLPPAAGNGIVAPLPIKRQGWMKMLAAS
jgi:hypothetical protein